MRFCFLISSLAPFRVTFAIDDENLFSDELYEPFDEWTIEFDFGIDFESLLWNHDEQLTQNINFNLASLSINDESNRLLS